MKVLFYPDPPVQQSGHSLSKTIRYMQLNGCTLTNNIKDHWDFGIWWNYKDVNTTPKQLVNEHRPVINRLCNNVTKSHVDNVFTNVFGYSSLADTTKYGYCVRKSDRQSAHDGVITKMPCTKTKGYIYQLLLDNRMSLTDVYDIRFPVFFGDIPLIFIKGRTCEGSFENTLSKKKMYRIALTGEFVDQYELKLIRIFCTEIGLDVGEIDAIRDNSTGRLYLIDVNDLPGGAVFDHIPDGRAVELSLARYFKQKIYEKYRLVL